MQAWWDKFVHFKVTRFSIESQAVEEGEDYAEGTRGDDPLRRSWVIATSYVRAAV